MGQYYRFYNKTRQAKAVYNHPENGGLPWIPKLEQWSRSELLQLFVELCAREGWQTTDRVLAIGDSYDLIIFENTTIKASFPIREQDYDSDESEFDAIYDGHNTKEVVVEDDDEDIDEGVDPEVVAERREFGNIFDDGDGVVHYSR